MNTNLPPRFSEPLTEYTMAELQAHNQLLQGEVQRVRNICNYFVRNGLVKAAPARKPIQLRRKTA